MPWLGELMGLAKTDRYLITEIHPEEGKRMGVFAWDDLVPFSLETAAEVHFVEPTTALVDRPELPNLETAVKVSAFVPGSLFE